jgi:hypothetical protein
MRKRSSAAGAGSAPKAHPPLAEKLELRNNDLLTFSIIVDKL